ncbi:MAG: hypothetical protein Q7T30_01110, partial [Planctomycetota bacterium]|nr:hypothetical protein [Planctomycetota bacterium]
ISHTFGQAGFHRVEARLEATDHFPLDDRRTFAIEVRDKSRVLLVDGEPDVDEGEAYYLQNALDPDGDARFGIEAQVVSETALGEADLDSFDLVWLCNVQAPPVSAAQRLEQFVAAGGGLAISVGALVDATRYNELFWRDGAGVLPLPLGEIGGDPDKPEHAVLVKKDHPICSRLGDILELLTNRVLLVKRWLTIVDDGKHGASIVARIRDAEGPPLLVTRTFGSGGGEVSLFAITADRFWSNMPSTDLLVPIVNELHRYAARRRDPSGSNLLPGGSYRLQLDPGVYRADVAIRAIGGDGDERTFTAAEPQSPAGVNQPAQQPLALAVAMGDLRQLGAYEVELARHDNTPEKRLLARNAETTESRLVGFLDSAFARLYPKELHDRVTFVGEGGGIGSGSGEGEIWKLLAGALLLGLLLESLLAWRFGRR